MNDLQLIFVFGTLKEGFPNFHVNRGRRVPGDFLTVEALPLWLVGERCTPWMVALPGQGQRVRGQLFEVDAAVLADMDRLEGVGEPHGYHRLPLDVAPAGAEGDDDRAGDAGRRRGAVTPIPGVMAYLKLPGQLEGQTVHSGPHPEYTDALAALYRQRPTPPLYQATVPVLVRYLGQLARLLEQPGAADLLHTRLAPDMLPLHAQVATAAHLALRISHPLVGSAVPPYGDEPPTAEGLARRLARVRALLQALPAEAFTYAAERQVHEQAGQATLVLPAPSFVHSFGMPNFFFHLAMAYATLRHAGLPIGKADFDGWHRY